MQYNIGMILEIVIDRHPPSTNNLFLTVGKRRVKTREYRAFEAMVHAILYRRGDRPQVSGMADRPYKLVIELISSKWVCKNGSMLRKDAGNYEKALSDTVAEFYGLKDEYNMELTVRKVHGPAEWTRATFDFSADPAP